jgi:hypothetical protein
MHSIHTYIQTCIAILKYTIYFYRFWFSPEQRAQHSTGAADAWERSRSCGRLIVHAPLRRDACPAAGLVETLPVLLYIHHIRCPRIQNFLSLMPSLMHCKHTYTCYTYLRFLHIHTHINTYIIFTVFRKGNSSFFAWRKKLCKSRLGSYIELIIDVKYYLCVLYVCMYVYMWVYNFLSTWIDSLSAAACARHAVRFANALHTRWRHPRHSYQRTYGIVTTISMYVWYDMVWYGIVYHW